MMNKKKIFILTLSDLRYDARVRRQVQALKDSYEITLSGFNGEESPAYHLVPISPTKLTIWRKAITSFFLLFRMYSSAHKTLHDYIDILQTKLKGREFDLIIANDIETLPLAFSLPGNHQVLYDAHEYAPRHFEDKLSWRIFFQDFNVWLCKKYLHRVGAMTTVGRGLALEYKKHFGVDAVLIPNANNYHDLQPAPLIENKIRLVHMGIANHSRKLELMIDMMSHLDERFSLDLFLLTPGFASKKTKQYIADLQMRAAKTASVRIFPPIKSVEVVKTINNYDIGVFLLPPINFNYENTLPNKLFDYIQARLGVAIGPTPEMAEIVEQFDLGVVSKDFTAASLALKLKNLTAQDIIRFKENSGKAARVYNAENNADVIRQIVAKLINAEHSAH